MVQCAAYRHPQEPVVQDPQNPKKRIYRVFSHIEDSSGTKSETGNAIKGAANVSTNKAMRDSVATVLTNKAAVFAKDPMSMHLAIKDQQYDDTSGREPKQRKTQKKVPTAEEKKQKDFDASMRKNFVWYSTHTHYVPYSMCFRRWFGSGYVSQNCSKHCLGFHNCLRKHALQPPRSQRRASATSRLDFDQHQLQSTSYLGSQELVNSLKDACTAADDVYKQHDPQNS